MASGLSLGAMARETNYDKGHLSRIERGLREPGPELIALYELLAARDGTVPVPAAAPLAELGERDRAEAAAGFEISFEQYKTMGREMPAGLVLPALIGLVESIRMTARAGSRPDRRLLRQAARVAEYTGWMAQEAGDPAASLHWTGEAAELAAFADYRDLHAYAWVRRAELELYAGRAPMVITLAERAHADSRVHPRVRALAAQRAGQGHAVLGDAVRCLGALDQADRLWDSADEPLPFGPATMSDPRRFVRGWCWFDLGRSDRAVEELSAATAGHRSRRSRRVRALFGTRLARAHIAAGDLREGLDVARRSFHALSSTGSASARTEFVALLHTLDGSASRSAAEFVAEVRAALPPSGDAARELETGAM